MKTRIKKNLLLLCLSFLTSSIAVSQLTQWDETFSGTTLSSKVAPYLDSTVVMTQENALNLQYKGDSV